MPTACCSCRWVMLGEVFWVDSETSSDMTPRRRGEAHLTYPLPANGITITANGSAL